MPDFSTRSNEIEIMDDLRCTGQVLDQTLRELEFINKWLGGNKITINAIDRLLKDTSKREVTIVDLGCGGGDMLKIIDAWGKRKKLKLKLMGVDANPYIVDFAKKNLKDYPNIHFETMDIFSGDFQQRKYDIVVGTLFYHHFLSTQLTAFFKQLRQQVYIGYVINDLHRHWLAYYAIKILTQIFSKSSMVKYDAPLSVLRAFKREELKQILIASQPIKFEIRWKWAFRWQVVAKVKSEGRVANL